jgi:hypothetical protein
MFAEQRRKNRLQTLIRQWVEYRDTVLAHLGDETATQEQEQRFLELKGGIARTLTEVVDEFPPGHLRQASLNQKGILDFIAQYPTLRTGKPLTDEQKDMFERAWQRHYLTMNQMAAVGGAPDGKKKASGGMQAPIPAGGGGHRGRGMGRIFDHWFVRVVVIVAVLTGALWVLAATLPWERMNGTPSVAAVKNVADDAGSALKSGVSDVGGMADESLTGVRRFLQPVINQWGPEATAIMCTVLLLLLGYWIFIRTR